MRLSTTVTLVIGLIAGALLTTALATSSGRFSLQLCPVPALEDQASGVRSSGEEPWTRTR